MAETVKGTIRAIDVDDGWVRIRIDSGTSSRVLKALKLAMVDERGVVLHVPSSPNEGTPPGGGNG